MAGYCGNGGADEGGLQTVTEDCCHITFPVCGMDLWKRQFFKGLRGLICALSTALRGRKRCYGHESRIE